MRITTYIALGVAMGAVVCGCSSEAKDQYQDAGKSLSRATEATGDAIAADAKGAKKSADEALESGKVKTALDSASGLDTSKIQVHTDMGTKKISLDGSVTTGAQKNQANSVAKGIAGTEFKLVDNLVVAAKS